MFKLADRVKQSSSTSGTGDIAFQEATSGYQTFQDAIGDGNSTYYVIESFTQFEIGIGTYSSSGDTLSRDLVIVSSDGTNKVDLSVGVKNVFVTYPASRHVLLDDDGYAYSHEPNYAGIKFPDGTTQVAAISRDDFDRQTSLVNSDTILDETADVVLITSLSLDMSLTLPNATSMDGKTISVKFQSGQKKCTIIPDGTDQIDGDSSYILKYLNESISLLSASGDWIIL